MNESELIDIIHRRFEQVNKDFLYKSPEGGHKPISYFKFDLPAKRKNGIGSEFPYILSRAVEGEVLDIDENVVTVITEIGVYDDNTDHQGYNDAVIIKQRIMQDLFARPILENGPILKRYFKWEYFEEKQPYPYYTLFITTKWDIKAPQWSQYSELT